MSMTEVSIDARQFRNALGSFTTGVTIVTTRDSSGHDVGLTVNSFNSVSLDPPLVLWSLDRNSASLSAFVEAEYFAVHILAADQEPLSNLFAKRGTDKFLGLDPARGHGGIPLLDGCSARFECRSTFRYDGGDHEIFVGEVITFEHFGLPPLVFQGGRYALALQKAARTEREAKPRADGDYQLAHQSALQVLLGMAYHQLNTNYKPELLRFDLKEEEYWVLNWLGAEPGRTLRVLDEFMTFTARNVTTAALVEDMQQRGFLTLDSSAGETHAYLTDQGRRALIEVAAETKSIETHTENGLDFTEVQLLKQLLQRYIRSSVRENKGS